MMSLRSPRYQAYAQGYWRNFTFCRARRLFWGALFSLACTTVALAQTLDRIEAAGVVRIGFVADQAPFASKSADGTPAGYAIDLCSRIVADIRHQSTAAVRIVYVETTLTDAFADIAADRLDLLCGALTITLKRRELVDFSEPIFLTGASAMLRRDAPRDLRELFLGERTISPPRSPELRPFATSRVGVRQGTTTEAVLQHAVSEGGFKTEIVGFDTHAQGKDALKAGKIDAYFADRVLLETSLQGEPPSSGLMLATRLFTNEAYGVAMKRGDSDLRLAVDRSLSTFYASDDFADLLARYFGGKGQPLRALVQSYAAPE